MPLKIYYIDDEPALLEMFVDLFSAPGLEITTFNDPKTAIEAVKSHPPDVLFIDYRLPNYTGDQVAQLLDPAIPKFLITGDMHVKTVYEFKKIFEKPYKSIDIETVIRSFLNP